MFRISCNLLRSQSSVNLYGITRTEKKSRQKEKKTKVDFPFVLKSFACLGTLNERQLKRKKKKWFPDVTLIFECPLSLVARGELSQEHQSYISLVQDYKHLA